MKSCLRILGAVLFSVLLAISLTACGSGDDDDYSLLVGTWDLSEIHTIDDIGVLDPGTVILDLTDTTWEETSSDCIKTGTYTPDATTLTLTIETVTDLTDAGYCGEVGEVNVLPYSVNETTLTITDDDRTLIWNRL